MFVRPLSAEETKTEEAPQVTEEITAEETTFKIPEYYLGIQCEPVPEILALQLNLENTGLLVTSVVPEGPAEKGGVKRGDILLNIGGKPVAKITEIFEVLDRDKDKEQALEVLHRGKKTELKITPEKRPETPPQASRPMQGMFRTIQPGIIFNGKDPGEARQMIQKFLEQMEGFDGNAELLDGNAIPFESVPFGTDDEGADIERFEYSVRPGEQPGTQRIQVRHNNEVWDVDKIEDLPKELQDRIRGITPSQEKAAPPAPKTEAQTDAKPAPEKSSWESWEAFRDKMKKEMDSLGEEVEKLSEKAPDFGKIYEDYRKSVEEYINSFWDSQPKEAEKKE